MGELRVVAGVVVIALGCDCRGAQGVRLLRAERARTVGL